MEFKALPVNHTPNAPGACMYIFHDKKTMKKIIITGDFHKIDDKVMNNKDFKDPTLIILETNNIKANETDHTNWENNKKIIKKFKSDANKTLVLLTHIAGFEDYKQGYYDHIPTDQDWAEEIANFKPPDHTTVELAEDGKSYDI
jgi:ribonuclease BN (tRNA processing enzyme)